MSFPQLFSRFSHSAKKYLALSLAVTSTTLLVSLSSSPAALAQGASGTVKVGAVFPMTGTSATFGQESVNGIKLALEEINKKGIKGKKIQIIVEDDKGEPVESANSVRKMINMDKVVAILGSVASSNTLAAAPIAQDAKVPLLTPASTNEKVTEMGDFISRICFTDAFQGKVMAKFARTTLKKSRAAIIVDSSSDYSKGLAAVFKSTFESMGGKVVSSDLAYQQKDVDFRSLLRKLTRLNADVVFLPGYYQEVGLLLTQARQIGINMPFLGGDGWDSPTLQKLASSQALKDAYISSHFSAEDKEPHVQSFVKAYVDRYKQKPGAMAALGYDSILVLADALNRAKSMTPVEIKAAINATKDFKGVTGGITLDKKRNAIKSAVVLKVTTNGNIFEQKVLP